MNDVLLNRKVSIERCIAQIRRYYAMAATMPFQQDHLRQDAIAMNLQRACEAAIDIANHLIKTRKLGLPQDSKESFALLQEAGLIDTKLSAAMQAMVGFRNVLVHQYQKLDLTIMVDVVEHRLGDLLDLANAALAASGMDA
jgi:uncharacterized protein YutE (UPF0331/DUF86 family)